MAKHTKANDVPRDEDDETMVIAAPEPAPEPAPEIPPMPKGPYGEKDPAALAWLKRYKPERYAGIVAKHPLIAIPD